MPPLRGPTPAPGEPRSEALEPDLDAPAARGELGGVGGDSNDLLEAIGVAGDGSRGRVEMGDEQEALRVDRGFHRLDGRPDYCREIDRARLDPEVPGHDPGDIQEVLDHPGLGAGAALDHVERVGGGRLVERAGPQQLDPAEDRVERGAQLVGERRDELVLAPGDRLRFAPSRLLALEGKSLLPLGLAPGGDVAEHEHGARDGALLRPDGGGAVVDRDGCHHREPGGRCRSRDPDPSFSENPGHRALDRALGGLVDDPEHRLELAPAPPPRSIP